MTIQTSENKEQDTDGAFLYQWETLEEFRNVKCHIQEKSKHTVTERFNQLHEEHNDLIYHLNRDLYNYDPGNLNQTQLRILVSKNPLATIASVIENDDVSEDTPTHTEVFCQTLDVTSGVEDDGIGTYTYDSDLNTYTLELDPEYYFEISFNESISKWQLVKYELPFNYLQSNSDTSEATDPPYNLLWDSVVLTNQNCYQCNSGIFIVSGAGEAAVNGIYIADGNDWIKDDAPTVLIELTSFGGPNYVYVFKVAGSSRYASGIFTLPPPDIDTIEWSSVNGGASPMPVVECLPITSSSSSSSELTDVTEIYEFKGHIEQVKALRKRFDFFILRCQKSNIYQV